MDDMMSQMSSGSMMMSSGGMMGGGGGHYSCQTMVMSSNMGADGKMHTEKFASSSVGNNQMGLRETQQAYSNSSTGMDKMSMERQMQDKGRKMVKERNRHTQEERQTEMFKGIEEHEAPQFDQEWDRRGAPNVPRHAGGGAGMRSI